MLKSSHADLSSLPRISVIAACYNHSKFLLECLESIRNQDYASIELIVTDDKSSDESPEMIQTWISDHWPSAQFLRHKENVGICRTLNEALALATGKYISLIATDDIWEPTKLSDLIGVIEKAEDSVGMIYADAYQIDENGTRLPETFLEAHGVAQWPPRDKVFPRLCDGNFIPAMSTLIRRDVLTELGGYDEALTYEDYDMWLRISDRYSILYCEKKVASYRILSTSMVRTLFENPTADHAFSYYLIANKWLYTGKLSTRQKKLWSEKKAQAAYSLYVHEDRRAKRCLWASLLDKFTIRQLGLAVTASLGIKRSSLKRLFKEPEPIRPD